MNVQALTRIEPLVMLAIRHEPAMTHICSRNHLNCALQTSGNSHSGMVVSFLRVLVIRMARCIPALERRLPLRYSLRTFPRRRTAYFFQSHMSNCLVLSWPARLHSSTLTEATNRTKIAVDIAFDATIILRLCQKSSRAGLPARAQTSLHVHDQSNMPTADHQLVTVLRVRRT